MKCAGFWKNPGPAKNSGNSCDSCAANFKGQKWKKFRNSNSMTAEPEKLQKKKPVLLKFGLFSKAEFTVKTGRILVLCVAVLCYANSLHGQFVFDDAEAIVRNKDAKWNGGSSVLELFSHDYWGYSIRSNTSHKSYRPLTVLTFRFNHWMSDSDPGSYHAVNILLHAAVSVMCYEFFRCAVLVFGKSEKAAFFSAILFACHPVHTECVANIAGRAELLSAFWFLLTFFLYRRSGEASRVLNVWYWMSMASAGFSMLSKEQGITVLGVLLMYDVLVTIDDSIIQSVRDLWNKALSDLNNNNDFNSNSLSPIKHRLQLLAVRAFVTGICGFIFILIRLWIVHFEPPNFTAADNPAAFHESILFRVLNYNYLYALNLWLLLNPRDLCFDYSMGCIPLIESLSDTRIFVVLIFWTAGFIAAYFILRSRPNQRYLLFGLACTIVPFLPASNAFVRVGFVLAERILYLPSIGYCFLVGGAFDSAQTLIGQLKHRAPSITKKHLEIIGCIVMVLFCTKSIQRSHEWCSEVTLFQSGVRVCPHNAKVHYNLGKILGDGGRVWEAEKKYREALELHPRYEQAMNNLANILKDKGRLVEAESLLLSAIKIRPDFSAAWMNLGIVQAALGKYSEAETSYLTALTHRKHYPDCYFNLGNLYLEQNRGYEALASWMNATQQRPTHARAWINQLVFLDSQDDCVRGVEVGGEAVGRVPGDPSIHFSLGSCLGKLGRTQVAEKHLLIALSLDPHNANYYSNLGVLYHRVERYYRAESMYRKALQLDPSLRHAEKNLKVLLRKIREK